MKKLLDLKFDGKGDACMEMIILILKFIMAIMEMIILFLQSIMSNTEIYNLFLLLMMGIVKVHVSFFKAFLVSLACQYILKK